MWFAKIQNCCEIDYLTSVVDFVTAKAPNFNKFQQSATSEPQTFQQESLKNNKIQQVSTRFGIWFGTRWPVVQIHLLRPFYSVDYAELPLFRPHCAVGTSSDSPDNYRLAIRAVRF